MSNIKLQERDNNKSLSEVSIEHLIKRYINSRDVMSSSKNTYRKQLNVFFDYLGEIGINSDNLNKITRRDVLDFKNDLGFAEKSIFTINSYIRTVKSFFKWLNKKIKDKDFSYLVEDINGFKEPNNHRKDCLTKEQVRRALNSINRSTLIGKRNYALFNLIVRTGLRTIEAQRALIKDIRQKSNHSVLYVKGKGRIEKDDFVLLTDKALQPILEYIQDREASEEEYIFVSHSNRNKGGKLSRRSIRRIIKGILKDIGLTTKRYSAHSLRHTAITLAIENGADIKQAKSMARHSNIETTMIYFHNVNRIENAAEKNIDI